VDECKPLVDGLNNSDVDWDALEMDRRTVMDRIWMNADKAGPRPRSLLIVHRYTTAAGSDTVSGQGTMMRRVCTRTCAPVQYEQTVSEKTGVGRPGTRGFHSFTFQLNLSCLCAPRNPN
jgi:hypothetical protein